MVDIKVGTAKCQLQNGICNVSYMAAFSEICKKQARILFDEKSMVIRKDFPPSDNLSALSPSKFLHKTHLQHQNT